MADKGHFSQVHPGGYDVKARLKALDEDGVFAEVLYPTVGMLLCNHQDYNYKQACFEAYNRWLAEFVAGAPDRLFGLGQTAARSAEDIVVDLHKMKEAGFVGAMLPGIPAQEDYDSPIYDRVWSTAEELELPLSVHILTSANANPAAILDYQTRGPKINKHHHSYKPCQDIIGLFIFTGIFERHPKLKLVTAEADAGWAPHYAYRSDTKYRIHRYSMNSLALEKMPSEYFFKHVYMTFQDDKVAFDMAHAMNSKRLCWASDFPHSDSTYPKSLDVLVGQSDKVTDETLADIVRNNTIELYNLPM
jgi:predicted TIM-barrel fold metal-dependent hydrolase